MAVFLSEMPEHTLPPPYNGLEFRIGSPGIQAYEQHPWIAAASIPGARVGGTKAGTVLQVQYLI
jgi:hypothetical protein